MNDLYSVCMFLKYSENVYIVITRSSEDIVIEVRVYPPQIISDHSATHFKIHETKPGPIKKEIAFTKLYTLDIKALCNDIQEPSLICNIPKNLPELVEQYNNILQDIFDKSCNYT